MDANPGKNANCCKSACFNSLACMVLVQYRRYATLHETHIDTNNSNQITLSCHNARSESNGWADTVKKVFETICS